MEILGVNFQSVAPGVVLGPMSVISPLVFKKSVPPIRKILSDNSLKTPISAPVRQPGCSPCCLGCDNTWLCLTGEVQSKFYLDRCKACGRVYTEHKSIKNLGSNYKLNNWRTHIPDECPLDIACYLDHCPNCEHWCKHHGAWVYAYPTSKEIGNIDKHDLSSGSIIRSLYECRNDPKTFIINPRYKQILRPELIYVPGREPVYDPEEGFIVLEDTPMVGGWWWQEPEIATSFACNSPPPVLPIFNLKVRVL